MLLVANAVLENGYVTLKSAFTKSFPNVDYNVTYVRRRLLQMPLACIRIQFDAGLSECYLVEHSPNTNYNALQGLIASVIQKTSKENPAPVSKEVVKELLGLCQSDRERECMRYAAFRFSGLSETQMRKQYGFEAMTKRSKKVNDAIEHAKYICRAIDEIACTRSESLCKALGVPSFCDQPSSSESDESTDDECVGESLQDYENSCFKSEKSNPQFTTSDLVDIVKASLFNYFEVIDRLQGSQISYVSLVELVEPHLTSQEMEQLKISFEAFTVDDELNSELNLREARAVNNEIVTDSESDSAEDICQVNSLFDDSVKDIVLKRQVAIKRSASRLKPKRIAEQNLLHRSLP